MKAWSNVEVPVLHPRPASGTRLRLYDTATQSLTEVGPAEGEARMYVCGITPYDATHLGHANTYVSFDLVNRVWRDLGLSVHYVQNVTDVDDPLLERAEQTGQTWEELAEQQTELFRDDMAALRVLPPDDYVGAVECVGCVSALLGEMSDSGFLYQVDDAEHPDWYFSVAAAPGFGGVSHLDREQMLALFAERGGDPERPGKKDALDCLVWRMAREGEPAWESPLGRGRPGWHIECTAIALKYLGAEFDVQGGGSDLVFPHHEMCAAEGVVASGEAFAATYVHSGMVGLDGQKMSKSLGNLVLSSTLRAEGTDPMAIRLALLAHHYRSDWEWSDAELVSAQQRLEIWRDAVQRDAGLDAGPTALAVREALLDDLNAPAAIAAIDAWAQASIAIDGDDTEAGGVISAACDALLGIAL